MSMYFETFEKSNHERPKQRKIESSHYYLRKNDSKKNATTECEKRHEMQQGIILIIIGSGTFSFSALFSISMET